MFFKNLSVYRLNLESPLDVDTLEAALAEHRAHPCQGQQISTYGFTAPFGKSPDAQLVHAVEGFALIAAQAEERILPASVIRDELQAKVEEIEAQESRKVYKKEKDQLKDEIVITLLPRAFVRKKVTQAAIDLNAGLIYVNTASANRAEEILSAVREALGSLPVRPVNVKMSPVANFTGWLKNDTVCQGFALMDECEMRDTDKDGGIIKIKREDLGSEEIQNLLSAGKLVTQIALTWDEKLTFTLDEKLTIKRLRFEELLQSEAEQDGGDDADSQFDASFVLMMKTFAEFIPQLLDALGGEEIPTQI